jgi:hypothetical protein
MIRARADGADIAILAVVKGLVADGDAVAKAIRETRPDAVGVSISREELAALRDKSLYDEYEMGALEEVYAEHLAELGEVELPAPCFVSALDTCTELGIPIIPLDMNDAEFTEAYCESVKAADMVRESLFTRRADKKRYDTSSPQAFARDWDRRVNKAKGFRELERRREEHMAAALRNMTRKYRSILAVVETERADGMGEMLGAPST